ncbi:HAD family hydrolase [Paenibacillus riograndensis]|uniref:HAD family hydrolase n=1 Tax=Paenibacillus riograndensis TaxID=483937 RepID=A0A132TMT5_9BACL|nr:HAD family hydrolase [Paenibacillus riograndensis]KWX72635.1 HAD family hydrolase [Paenibacillus riograndensis]KWX86361.1 HAD family hydrolase [Paenibacillus riograndensis]
MDSMIFDLDGTLWDSLDVVAEVWNRVLSEYKGSIGEVTKEDLRGIMGLQADEAGRKMFPGLDEEAQQKILGQCYDAECVSLAEQGGRLFEQLEEVLKVLSAKYKLFIVSNCQDGYIEAFYEYHQLQKYFVDFENPGRTGLSKGENIKLVMERNNLKNPVYVGDTEKDLKAARDAGIPFVFASYGFGEVSDYDYIINSFEGLLELF